MQRRRLGRTNLDVAVLGFGAMRLPPPDAWDRVDFDLAVPLLMSAIDKGVNYIDTAYVYAMSELAVGKALAAAGAGRQVYISTKNIIKDNDPVAWRRQLDESIQRLGRCPDILHIHDVSWGQMSNIFLAGGLLKEVRRAQSQGLFKFLAFSSHDKPEGIEQIIDTGEFDSCTLQHNFLYRRNAAMIDHAHACGLGVVIMGPLGGGRLVSLGQASGDGHLDQAQLAALALRFVMNNPAISVVLSGMFNNDQLEKNIATADDLQPLSAAELAHLDELATLRGQFTDLYCTGCGYCLPCPSGVDIRRVFLLYNLLRVNMHDPARLEYNFLRSSHTAADSCTECGTCLRECPQHIEISNRLKEAHKALTTW